MTIAAIIAIPPATPPTIAAIGSPSDDELERETSGSKVAGVVRGKSGQVVVAGVVRGKSGQVVGT